MTEREKRKRDGANNRDRPQALYTNFSLRLHYSEGTGKEGHAEAIPPEPA
jgi:hypothetical protein